MSKKGFFIKKLELSGLRVESRKVEFGKGLNVIFGSSDTGKTFIFQCIKYMLGKGTPKEVPESYSYNKVQLVIETYSGEEYVLERDLSDSDFKLLDKDKKFIKELKKENKAKKEDTISDFLLDICNMSDKEIRKNAQGGKKKLYFQNLMKYFLLDEANIIKEDSLITTGQHIEKTFDKNTFKYLLTGKDDSLISVVEDDGDIEYRKGKLALYDELIKQLNQDLEESEFNDIDEQILEIDEQIKNYESTYLESKIDLNKNNEEKNRLAKEILIEERALINNYEILTRAKLLKKQYMSDISRLEATLDTGIHLESVSSRNCPVCESDIENNINSDELISATKAEIHKIKLLLKELEESQKIYNSETKDMEEKLSSKKGHLNDVIIKIENELKDFLKGLSKIIKKFSDKKQELARIKTLKEKLDDYINKKNQISISTSNNVDKTSFEGLTASLMSPVVTELKNILQAIDFDNPKDADVHFSEDSLDFVIGPKNRKDFGKGYRAILYASFVIALLQHLKDKPFQIGTVVIDSPLNPYKPDDKKVDKITNDLANNFYNYLYENIKNEQVILIENTALPDNLKNCVNYYEFTKEKGFLPSLSN